MVTVVEDKICWAQDKVAKLGFFLQQQQALNRQQAVVYALREKIGRQIFKDRYTEQKQKAIRRWR
jgi:ubiquinone biosynthesis protein Coq4